MARQSIGVLQAYGGKWHLRCRPPYEEQNARISILVNGIAERPDTFVQTVLGQLQKPLADGAGHTFSARRRAVRLDMRGVDHLRVRAAATRGKFSEQVFPDAAPRPTHKAIIDRRRRTVLGRTIAPATAAFQHMDDAADHPAIVRPRDAPDIRRQVALNQVLVERFQSSNHKGWPKRPHSVDGKPKM